MRDTDLFQMALGLVPPWWVKDCRFDAAAKRLDIEIDFKTGGRFACPDCNAADCPVHDTVSGVISTSSSIRPFCTRARRASRA